MSEAEDTYGLNGAEYLYLLSISEPRDNSVLLRVREAVVNYSSVARVEGLGEPFSKLLEGASPIESTADCRAYELHWRHYIAYLVTEEGAGSCGEYQDEVFTGKLLRVYTKSHFLDHLGRDTGGHMRPLRHYKVVCLNHLVDVASEEPPEIRLIGEPGPRLQRGSTGQGSV